MNCQKVRKLLSPWLDGELTGEEAKALSVHLAKCPLCVSEQDELRALTGALQKMRELVAPPEGFAVLVIERLSKEIAGEETAVLTEAVAAAGKITQFDGRKAPVPDSKGIARVRRTFAGWWPGLRIGWKKGLAIAAALAMLFTGSVTFAARYLGGPGIFNPFLVAEQISPLGGDGDLQTGQDNQDDLIKIDSTETKGSPQNSGEEKGLVPDLDEVNKGRQQVADNSQIGPNNSPEKPTGNVSVGSGLKEQEVASSGLATGKEARVFLNCSRSVESRLIKVRVKDLELAAGHLKANAAVRDASCTVNSKVPDGENIIEIFQFKIPQIGAEQFVTYVSSLGQVFESTREVRDTSNVFAEKLERYQSLFAERKSASGEQTKKLDSEIQEIEAELTEMDKKAHEQLVVITVLLVGSKDT